MRNLRYIFPLILVLVAIPGYGAKITTVELPKINGIVIVDNEGEQYIAATDRGLYHSHDHGHSWKPHKTGYDLPATMVTTTPQGRLYAFVVTLGLLEFNLQSSLWQEVSNNFGSQVLRHLASTSLTPARMVALNHFGKLIQSENYGSDWHKVGGPVHAKTPAEQRGRDLYAKICLSCHGIEGVGENYSQQALTDKSYIMAPALDASAHAWHHSDADLVKTIREGSPRTKRMAAWQDAGVSAEDAADLVAYIKSLWTQRELDCQGPKHMQCMQ